MNNGTLYKDRSGQVDLFKVGVGIFSAITVAGLLYIGSFVLDVQVRLAEIQKDIISVQVDIQESKDAQIRLLADRYTSTNARADWRLQERENTLIKERLEALGERLNALEDG